MLSFFIVTIPVSAGLSDIFEQCLYYTHHRAENTLYSFTLSPSGVHTTETFKKSLDKHVWISK